MFFLMKKMFIIFYEKLTHKTKTIARFLSCFNICVYIVHIIFYCLHLFVHFYIRSFILNITT